MIQVETASSRSDACESIAFCLKMISRSRSHLTVRNCTNPRRFCFAVIAYCSCTSERTLHIEHTIREKRMRTENSSCISVEVTCTCSYNGGFIAFCLCINLECRRFMPIGSGLNIVYRGQTVLPDSHSSCESSLPIKSIEIRELVL